MKSSSQHIQDFSALPEKSDSSLPCQTRHQRRESFRYFVCGMRYSKELMADFLDPTDNTFATYAEGGGGGR